MHLVDEYHFHAAAGKGGDGVVRWRREKFLPKGGPNGGDGGRGGDVILEAIRDIMMLGRILHKDQYAAEPGEPGGNSSKTGADGKDLLIRLPVGSVIRNTSSGETIELLRDGERVTLLMGGDGGYGNEHFKSATNQQPRECTQGKEGEQGDFTVELRLIADVGLVGLPNAGKTSLLNALTNAGAKVGDYPFTTLDPNLGVYHGYVLADVPGLIEGASEGRGLGHKFLRHISRTSLILHCISLARENILDDFKVVQKELASMENIRDKQQYVVLTKSDTVQAEHIQETVSTVTAAGGKVLAAVSILDDESLKTLGDELSKALKVLAAVGDKDV